VKTFYYRVLNVVFCTNGYTCI